MLRTFVIIIFLIVLVHAEPPRLVDQLPQSSLQSAFQILRRDYIRRDELTFEELNRAALQGLLERLNFSAQLMLLDQKTTPQKPHIHAEFLAPDIAYLRPETFCEGEALIFEKELARIAMQKAKHLILDLRAAKAPGSFDEAALMLQCFVPKGELMFKMKRIGRDEAELFISRREPLWLGRVIVLTDGETNNAAEAVAAVLQHRNLALIIGEPTRGQAVRYSEVKLDDKIALRYAVAEMLLPDGTAIFKKGVRPMIVVQASMEEKWKAIDGSREKSLKPFVTDWVRSRFNEAALVGEKNPELDDYVRRTAGQPLPGDEGQVRDVVTQRALDVLRAGDFSADAKIKWDTSSPAAEPKKPEAPKAERAKP
jgi:hypothetical protein